MSTPTRRVLRRACLPCVGVVTLVVATALPASAHVTVSSPDVVPGGDGTLVLRVPTESASASTTAVQVRLPRTHPFASVSVRPLDGWTVTTREQRLPEPVTEDGFTLTRAVATVTWTARPGHGVRPGEFQEFEVSVGPFPRRGAVVLPVVQTYSDASVVRWDQPTPASGQEPEHPAPTLRVGAPLGTAAAAAASATGSASDGTARWLGGAGLLLGVVAVVLAATGRGRSARR